MRYFVGIVVLSLLAVIGYYAWDAYGARVVTPPPPPPPPPPTMNTFATTSFSIRYPSNFTVNDAYQYRAFEGKPISGVSFTVPLTETEETNLSPDSYLSVEWLPRAINCTGDIYVVPNVGAIDVLVGSTTYSVATTTSAAAGNIYEEHVYAVPDSKPCTAVRYFIHSTDAGNFEPGAVREFDRAALLRTLDSIRDALVLTK